MSILRPNLLLWVAAVNSESSTVLRCLGRALVSLMEGKILYGDELVPQEAQWLSQTWYVEMSLIGY